MVILHSNETVNTLPISQRRGHLGLPTFLSICSDRDSFNILMNKPKKQERKR